MTTAIRRATDSALVSCCNLVPDVADFTELGDYIAVTFVGQGIIEVS
jgi:hypothetical protein